MTPLLRRLRLFWTRSIAPAPLERDPAFRATMDGLTRRGLRVAGALALAAVALYLAAHLGAGKALVWSFRGLDPGTHVVLWDKALIAGLGVLLLVAARGRGDVRLGRLLMAAFLLLAAWALVMEDYARADFTFTAGWLALLMLVTVGTVPFQPWQAGAICLGIAGLYVYYGSRPAAVIASVSAGVPVSRVIFLLLVTFLCTSMSASLYLSRYEQYRALRRAAGLRDRLSARGRTLAHSLGRLRAAQAQLVQQEKLAGLGQLTAGVAHEIKNPLNFVTNFAQLSRDLLRELHDELESDPERPCGEAMADVADLLDDLALNTEKIAEHGRRADGIVKSMLAHSRTSPGERQPVDLNGLLDEYVNLAYHGMRARHAGFNVEIERAFDPAVGAVPLVAGEMGRAFLNLLDNAFDAVRARAAASGPTYRPTVRVETRIAPGGGAVRIADNGTGVPAAVRARVFEPFFTTKPSGEGTGLGLSLAYEIVTQGHGGTLTMETEEGAGTAFTIVLPSRSPEGALSDGAGAADTARVAPGRAARPA
jgi:signal transduction histidine kinase